MKKVINLLYIIATLSIGGAERQLIELIRRLDRKKYNPILCCLTRGGPLLDEARELGIKTVILNKRFKFDFSVIPRLISLVKKEKIVLVHTYMFTSNAFGRLAAVLARVPVIISSERSVDVWKRWYHRSIDRFLAKFADRIIANCQAVREFYIKKERIRPSKIVVVYNGVDISKFNKNGIDVQRAREELGVNPRTYIVGSIGRLDRAKGYSYLIHAAKSILEELPQTKFLILGDGPEKRRLENLAQELNLSSKVLFMGEVRDVRKILAILDVFVLSSIREGHSNVLLEAMAMGKPVVATDVGGNPETIIDEQTGILVPPKDANALARGIIKVLQDEKLAKKMGEAGRKRVKEKFSIERTVAQTEELYNTLIPQKMGS